jgi:hypothetical protein
VPRELFERVLAIADGLAAALAHRNTTPSTLAAGAGSASTAEMSELEPLTTAGASTIAATLHALDGIRATAGPRPSRFDGAEGDSYDLHSTTSAGRVAAASGSPYHSGYGPLTAHGGSPSAFSAVSATSARGRLRYHQSTPALQSTTPDRHRHPPLSSRSPSFANAGANAGGIGNVAPSVPPARYPLLANGQLDRIVVALGAGRQEWALCNSSTTTTYTVSATFPAPDDVEPLGVTAVPAEGGRFVLCVPPGETRPFVRGITHGARITVANGSASAESRSGSMAA